MRIALCAVTVLAGLGAARAADLDPIAVRKSVMDLQGADIAYIESVVKAKGDVKPLEGPAKAMARSAALIPALFPAGSDKGDTKALAEIWSDNAGFEKNATALHDAASKLAVAAKAGDAETVASEFKVMGEQCGSCHRHYRAK